MAIVIFNSEFVDEGFLKRQGGVIGLINSYNIVVDRLIFRFKWNI
jgi:hypothetical protein